MLTTKKIHPQSHTNLSIASWRHWLFGSRARGDHQPDSDWDLLAVLPDTAPDEALDLEVVWRLFRDLRLKKVDVFPVRKGAFEIACRAFGSLSQIAATEGKKVYVS